MIVFIYTIQEIIVLLREKYYLKKIGWDRLGILIITSYFLKKEQNLCCILFYYRCYDFSNDTINNILIPTSTNIKNVAFSHGNLIFSSDVLQMYKIINSQKIENDFMNIFEHSLYYPEFKINIMSCSMSRIILLDTRKAQLFVLKYSDPQFDSPYTWIPDEI